MAGPLPAQLHDRRGAAPLPLVADALPGRRDRGLSLGPQAGPDLRALRGRARGREPLRPRPALPDLQLPVGGPGPTVQRGRPPGGRRRGQRHHGAFRPRAARARRHAHDAREDAVANPHAAAAVARRLPGRLGHHRGGRQPALLPRARPGQPGRLPRAAGQAGGALHAHHALLGPPRPRPGRPGARAAHGRPGRGHLHRPAPARLLEPDRVVPPPAERGLRHRAREDRVARGLAGSDGGRARLAPHGRRPHARRVPARAAGQVRDRDRGAARRRGPAAGGRAGRPRLRRPAHAGRDPRPDARGPGDAGLLRPEVRPVAVPDSRPRGGRGRDSRRPQPARARLPSGAPAGAAFALSPRGSFELQRPARLLPGARDGSPVVGRGHGPGELPRALALRGLGAVLRRAVAARAARGRGVSRHDGPDGPLGDSFRLLRPHPPRPAPRATSSRTGASSGRSCTTRAPGCSTC